VPDASVLFEAREMCDHVFIMCNGVIALMEKGESGDEICVAHVQVCVPSLAPMFLCVSVCVRACVFLCISVCV
jgi:hypothetical protein